MRIVLLVMLVASSARAAYYGITGGGGGGSCQPPMSDSVSLSISGVSETNAAPSDTAIVGVNALEANAAPTDAVVVGLSQTESNLSPVDAFLGPRISAFETSLAYGNLSVFKAEHFEGK